MAAEKVRCFMTNSPFLKRSRVLCFLCFGLYCFKLAKSTGRTDKIRMLFFPLFVDCHKVLFLRSGNCRSGGTLPEHRTSSSRLIDHARKERRAVQPGDDED